METINNMEPETIEGLQELIQINIDSAEGMRASADVIDAPVIKSCFIEVAGERLGFAEELTRFVTLNAEAPPRDGSLKAKAHRWWLKVRAGLSNDELTAVLSEAERGEDAICGAYEDVIKRTTGNPVNDVLHRQYARVKEAHDAVRGLRDHVAKQD